MLDLDFGKLGAVEGCFGDPKLVFRIYRPIDYRLQANFSIQGDMQGEISKNQCGPYFFTGVSYGLAVNASELHFMLFSFQLQRCSKIAQAIDLKFHFKEIKMSKSWGKRETVNGQS